MDTQQDFRLCIPSKSQVLEHDVMECCDCKTPIAVPHNIKHNAKDAKFICYSCYSERLFEPIDRNNKPLWIFAIYLITSLVILCFLIARMTWGISHAP